MVEQFAECGLGDGNLLPKRGKTLFWNVDFLLDLEVGGDQGVLRDSFTRSDWKTDSPRKLEQDPHTQVIERGLGANDVPGNTHLLRVRADESWWGSLPTEFANMIRDGS